MAEPLTPFVRASRKGDDQIVASTLQQDPDVIDREGFHGLMVACRAGYIKVVQILLQHGVDVNATIRDKEAVFAILGHRRLGDALFYWGDAFDLFGPKENENIGETALMWACHGGQVKVVEFLIDHGADVNAKCMDGSTPLMFASKKGFDEVIEVLIKRGADLNAQDAHGFTAMMAAVRNGDEKVVELLIERGANVHLRQCNGYSSFLEACFHGHDAIIDIFMGLGVDVDDRDKRGNPGLKLAIFGSQDEDVVRRLLDHGADVNLTNEDGVTALMEASGMGLDNIVRLLLKHNAIVDLQCKRDKKTAIIRAVFQGSVECVQALLLVGADLDYADRDGDTVFTYAMRLESTEILMALLEDGRLMEGGNLKPMHRDVSILRPWNAFKALKATIEAGVFEWEWCTLPLLTTASLAALESGLSPGKIKDHWNKRFSPLVLSVMENETELTELFLERLYYFPEDYRTLCTDEDIRERITNTDILDRITLKPLSLLTWSFLTVSYAISQAGLPKMRRHLVESLPIPNIFKRRLNFEEVHEFSRRSYSKTICIQSLLPVPDRVFRFPDIWC